MNILLYRDLSSEDLAALRKEFPTDSFRSATTPMQIQDLLDWPEIVFGNAPANLLLRMPQLRWLQIVSSGFDEYNAMRGTTVTVTTAHGVHATIIAQHVTMTILMFARGQPHFTARQREKVWDRRPAVPQCIEGQAVGLIGYGAVAQEIARLVRPFGLRILATKRTPVARIPANVDELVAWERLDDLLAASDHIVLTLPLTEATRRVLDRQRIGRLKHSAVLHNVGRGGLVDEAALIERLQNGSLGGAALDVFEHEPLPATSPLWELPNVIVTPHIAGHHRQLGQLVLERFKANLRCYVVGFPLKHVADFNRGY